MVRVSYSPMFIAKSAQNLRKRMTFAQEKLWTALTTGFDSARFRRQYSIGNHTVDFYCRKLRFIIEIGKTSDVHILQPKDRDSFLRACGYEILRFTEKEIVDDFESVISRIKTKILVIKFKVQVLALRESLSRFIISLWYKPFTSKQNALKPQHCLSFVTAH